MKSNTAAFVAGLRRFACAAARQTNLPVALGNVAFANVRAIDGKAGQDFAQRDPQRIEREIPRAPVPLGNAIEPVGEQLQIARHGRAEDQQLRLVRHLAEIEPLVDEAAVDLGQFGQPGRIDEQPVHGVQKIVARGAGQQPLLGQGLLGRRESFPPPRRAEASCDGRLQVSLRSTCRQERRLDVAPAAAGSEDVGSTSSSWAVRLPPPAHRRLHGAASRPLLVSGFAQGQQIAPCNRRRYSVGSYSPSM